MNNHIRSKLELKHDIEAELAEVCEIINGNLSNVAKCKLVEKVIRKIGQEIEEAKAHSMLDSRTGLLSAQFGDELLEREVELSNRTKAIFSLALLDIDFLKYINEAFGHVLGTEVIVRVAGEIKKAVRRSDMLCRYGGDEFLIIFPETTQKKAEEVVKRIRDAVGGLELPKDVKVTLSAGIKEYKPKSKISAYDFLDLVDQDLYLSKENRINMNLL